MRHSKTALFLMEIMFAILFFSIASAVCLQLFATAHTLSRDAKRLNKAVTVCQSAAAILEAEGADALDNFYTDGSWAGSRFTAPANGCVLDVSQTNEGCEIRALTSDGGTELYSLYVLLPEKGTPTDETQNANHL